MMMAVMAYDTKPFTGLSLSAQKKALRGILAGPVLFNRERKIALMDSSANCQAHGPSGDDPILAENRLFGFFGRTIKDGGRLVRTFGILKIVHARNDFILGVRAGLKAFADFGTRSSRCDGFGILGRGAFLGAKDRKGGTAVFLGHGDRGGCAGNQNKTSDGECDFTTFGSTHGYVSLALIKNALLMLGRDVSRVPLSWRMHAYCEGKRDQLWEFLGKMCAKTPQSSPKPGNRGTSFLNASLGDHLRRVAHHDGLAYVRRNPIFDGDTAR
jgi:hypothetical protein